MQVSSELHSWLTSLKLIFQDSKRLPEGQYELNKVVAQQFENGVLFVKLIKYLSKISASFEKNVEVPFPTLDTLKEMNSPSAKLYNWNIIIECLKHFKIIVEPEVKSLIIAGDHQMVVELIKEIYDKVKRINPIGQSNDPARRKLDTEQASNFRQGKQLSRGEINYKEQLDLSKIDLNKDVMQTYNCLEFLLVVLGKNLQLTPQQTATLFTNNNKYLAHILAKGVKGLFDPIVAIYQEIYVNSSHLINLFDEDPTKKSIIFVLNALKAGLVSKNYEVAQWTARLFSKIAFELSDSNLIGKAWEWFIGDNGGLNSTILGLKRHIELKELVVSLLIQFARYNFVELFSVHIKKLLPDPKELITFVSQIIKPLSESKVSRDEIITSGIVDEWLNLAIELASSEFTTAPESKALSLQFLVEVWLIFPQKIEDQEYKANQIINLLNKASGRDKSLTLVLSAVSYLFKLLITFGSSKNPYAPIIYKTITLALIENHVNLAAREFMLRNLMNAYELMESIPPNTVLEPYIKQIQVTENISEYFGIFDFEFFAFVAKHEKLQIKNAIQILDIMAKVYLNNIVFAPLAQTTLIALINRYQDDATLTEFVLKLIKIALAMFFASEKKKRPKEKILPLYNNKAAPNVVSKQQQHQQQNQQQQQINNVGINQQQYNLEQEIVNAQKRALIVELLYQIGTLNVQEINQKMKPLVIHTNLQIKIFSKMNNKGMLHILTLFGNNPEQIINEFEGQTKLDQQQQPDDNSLEDQQQDKSLLLMNTSEVDASKNKSKVGPKKRKLKISKADQMRLALLKNPKADPKILQELEDIKKNYIQKAEKQILQIEQKNKELEKQKAILRKQLEKRGIEQGVGTLNKPDVEVQLLFEFGSREKELLKDKKSGLPEIVFLELKTEEQRDNLMVETTLKKYSKIIRHLFYKYSGSGFSAKSINNFDAFKNRSTTINLPEVWKIIKDYELDGLLNQEEHKSLMRIVCLEHSKTKQDLTQFDFPCFQQFLVQLSAFIYSRPPEDLNHLPVGCALQHLFEQMREVTANKGLNTVLFDNPEGTYLGEADVIHEYNQQLQKNPNYPLPSGYKKIYDKVQKFKYELSPQLPVSDSLRFSTEILNEILMNGVGLSFIEPISFEETLVHAQPKVNLGLQPEAHYLDHFKKNINKPPIVLQPIQGNSGGLAPLDQELNTIEGERSSARKNPVQGLASQSGQRSQSVRRGLQSAEAGQQLQPIVYSSFLPKRAGHVIKPGDLQKKPMKMLQLERQYRQLSLGMKLAVSQFDFRDKYTAEQVGYVLDDVISAVENEKDYFITSKQINIENQAIKQKKNIQYQQEIEDKKQNKRRELRRQVVKKILEDRKKEQQIEFDKRQQELAEQQKSEQQKKKEFDQIKQKQLKEIRMKIAEHQLKKKEEVTKIQEEKIKVEQGKKHETSKQFKEFNQKAIVKMKENIDQRKKQQEEEKKEKEKEMEIKKKQLAKLHNKIMADAKVLKETEQSTNEKIIQLFKNQATQSIFNKNSVQLKSLYEFLQKIAFKNITEVVAKSELPLKTIQWFCVRFNIIPEIIKLNDCILVFRSIIREKAKLPDGSAPKPALSYEEFTEFLLRVAAKGKKVFNIFADKIEKDGNIQSQDMQNIISNNNINVQQQLAKQQQLPKISTLIPEEDDNKLNNEDAQIDNQANNLHDQIQGNLSRPDLGTANNTTTINNSKLVLPTNLDVSREIMINDSSFMDQKALENFSKALDTYGDISDVNSNTIAALIHYLDIPLNKLNMTERFKQILEKKHQPDRRRKQDLEKKIQQNSSQLQGNLSSFMMQPSEIGERANYQKKQRVLGSNEREKNSKSNDSNSGQAKDGTSNSQNRYQIGKNTARKDYSYDNIQDRANNKINEIKDQKNEDQNNKTLNSHKKSQEKIILENNDPPQILANQQESQKKDDGDNDEKQNLDQSGVQDKTQENINNDEVNEDDNNQQMENKTIQQAHNDSVLSNKSKDNENDQLQNDQQQ